MSLTSAYLLLAALLAVPGVLLSVPAGHGVLRAFPRSKPAAYALFGAAAGWFLYLLSQMGAADLAGIPKPVMLGAFGTAALAAFYYLDDLLAVRGLAGLLLLTSSRLLDAGVGQLPRSLALSILVYGLLILPALAYGTVPYLLRDAISGVLKTPGRARFAGAVFVVCAGIAGAAAAV